MTNRSVVAGAASQVLLVVATIFMNTLVGIPLTGTAFVMFWVLLSACALSAAATAWLACE